MTLRLYDFTTLRLHDFTTSQLHNFTTSQLHNSTISRVQNFTSSRVNEFMSSQLHEFTRSRVHQSRRYEFMSPVYEFMSLGPVKFFFFFRGGGGRDGDTLCTVSPYKQLLPLPTPYFKMFLERFLNDPHLPLPHLQASFTAIPTPALIKILIPH